ncbi:MAG: hypothetical protein Q4D19_13025 [Lautropia sp.]|nr:hypothetical protein [Lautropia sp.]
MSEVAALEPFGGFHSAFYFRELYLRDEVRYEKFYCPFCGVLLDPVLVYAPSDQELGKSPHFRTQRGGANHHDGCDGNPCNYQNPTRANPVQEHIQRLPFSLPTEFAAYVEPQSGSQSGSACRAPVPSLTPADIRRRREEAGRRYGVARFRVSLVQSLAEVHNAILKDAYRRKEENNWSKEEFNNWIKNVLQAPINLRGFSTTYRIALHDLWFAVPSCPRVFHGSQARVEQVEGGYQITSKRPGKVGKGNTVLPFVITVSLRDADGVELRGARRALLRQLERAVKEDATVRWYAYGRANMTDERFELAFDRANISDLFVKLQKKG